MTTADERGRERGIELAGWAPGGASETASGLDGSSGGPAARGPSGRHRAIRAGRGRGFAAASGALWPALVGSIMACVAVVLPAPAVAESVCTSADGCVVAVSCGPTDMPHSAIITCSGHHVTAHDGGGGVTVTDRASRGARETFEVIPLP